MDYVKPHDIVKRPVSALAGAFLAVATSMAVVAGRPNHTATIVPRRDR